jgi:hypothetical protein
VLEELTRKKAVAWREVAVKTYNNKALISVKARTKQKSPV